jgi:hypothetical protein
MVMSRDGFDGANSSLGSTARSPLGRSRREQQQKPIIGWSTQGYRREMLLTGFAGGWPRSAF